MNAKQIADLNKAQDLVAIAEQLLNQVMESLPTPADASDPTFDAVQDAQQDAYGLVIAIYQLARI